MFNDYRQVSAFFEFPSVALRSIYCSERQRCFRNRLQTPEKLSALLLPKGRKHQFLQFPRGGNHVQQSRFSLGGYVNLDGSAIFGIASFGYELS
jgi:hypothetical protein